MTCHGQPSTSEVKYIYTGQLAMTFEQGFHTKHLGRGICSFKQTHIAFLFPEILVESAAEIIDCNTLAATGGRAPKQNWVKKSIETRPNLDQISWPLAYARYYHASTLTD